LISQFRFLDKLLYNKTNSRCIHEYFNNVFVLFDFRKQYSPSKSKFYTIHKKKKKKHQTLAKQRNRKKTFLKQNKVRLETITNMLTKIQTHTTSP